MIRVEITHKHIKDGLRKSYVLDAVAEAIKDAVQKHYNVKPKSFQVIIPSRDLGFVEGCLFEVPQNVQEFLVRSDTGRKLEPMVFDLDLPDDLFQSKEGHP